MTSKNDSTSSNHSGLSEENYFDDSNSRDSGQNQQCSQDMFDDDSNSREGNNENPVKFNKKILHFKSMPTVPPVAVPEKIVICIDSSCETSYTSDLTKTEPSFYSIITEAMKLFITNKLSISKCTEIAIATIELGKVKWLSHLSSDAQHLIQSLDIDPIIHSKDSKCVGSDDGTNDFDITTIFGTVLNAIDIPEHTKIIPPNYLIRVIFIYGNSQIAPKVNTADTAYCKFMMSPNCIFDVLYLHERQSDCNNVEQIFKSFGKVISPMSYLMESSRNLTKIFNIVAKLLAHPYQRINQLAWEF